MNKPQYNPKYTTTKNIKLAYQQGKKETIEKIIKLFKEDSIYTGAVIKFEINNNLK